MRWVMVLAVAMAMAGCAAQIQNQARETASKDHMCPLEQVGVISDATVGMDYAYWLRVCGKRRLYRYKEEGKYGGRFIDATASVR